MIKSNKIIINIFFVLVCAAITAPLWVSKELLFPFVTSKAFVLRIGLELALPFYLYLVFSNKTLRPNLNPVRSKSRLVGTADPPLAGRTSNGVKNWLNTAVIGFVVINWLSAFLGVNVNRSLWGNFERMGGAFYITHLALLYFYILLLGQYSGKYVKWVLQFFLFVAAIIALNGVSGWLGGPTLTPVPSLPGRASSTLGNPIYLGSFLIIPMFLAAYFAAQAEGLGRKLYYGFLGIIYLLAIFQSGTRGAVVGLLAAIFAAFTALVIFTKSRKIKIGGGITLIVFVIVAGFLFANYEKLPEGTTLRRVFQLKDSNTQSRVLQWKVALKGFGDRPVLGTGPENYYVVANQYYNPEIYKYDRSWFDKPHNYLLEILVTNGVLGFVFYGAILILSVLVVYRGFKKDFLDLFQSCLLLAGFLAYQFQNLFVFDTVPASVAFYCFLGFLGYLSYEINFKKSELNGSVTGKNQNFAKVVFVISGVLAVYIVYAGNWMPARAAKNVNYGYAYLSADLRKSIEYFNKAITYPFNFDFTETGSKFGDLASNLSAGVDRGNAEKLKSAQEQIKKILAYEISVSEKVSNDPVIWQRLSNVYLYSAIVNNQPVPLEAIETLEKAINLAPNRVEARVALAQVRLFQGLKQEAVKIMEEVVALDPRYGGTRWQAALVYREAGEKEKALKAAQ